MNPRSIALVAAFSTAGCSDSSGEKLVPCLAASADWAAIEPTQEFAASGRELTAVFDLADNEAVKEAGGKLTHVWTAVDVGDVAPANSEIARGELELGSRRRGLVRYSQEVPLPIGRYRLDVLAGGKPWRSQELRVVADPAPLAVPPSMRLLPLIEGVTWEYDFKQEFGPRAKVSEPGVKLASDGTIRAKVTVTVAEEQEGARHLRFERDGVLRTEEWWRLEPDGLVAVRRRINDLDVAVDPPQPLVPLPPAACVAWTYESADGTISQRNRAFSPRTVVGPAGPASGIIVVTEHVMGPMRLTAERHWLVGFGLVREQIVQTFEDELVSRQDMSIAAGNRRDVSGG